MFSLKQLFDSKVVVSLEESWGKRWPGGRQQGDKLWCYEIKCKRGIIYPGSDTHIHVTTTPRIAKTLINILSPKAVLKQQGDFEYTIAVPLDCVNTIFKYLKPTRRRTLTTSVQEARTLRLRGRLLP